MGGPRIFVSHSSQDNEFGARLVNDLRQVLNDESAVWYDSWGGLHGGDLWWRKIVEELQTREVFAVVLSPDAVQSTYVNLEIDLAWRQKHKQWSRLIVPVLYRECVVRADLDVLQVISFLPPKSYNAAFTELLAALGLLAAHEVADHLGQSLDEENDLLPPLAIRASAGHTTDQTLTKRSLSRRTVVLGLAGLTAVGVIGGGLLWLTRSQQPTTSTPPPVRTPPSPLTYYGHTGEVYSVAWSSTSTRIASGCRDGTVRIWDATHEGNALIVYQKHTDMVFGVSWSPDSSKIASGSRDNTVHVWDADHGSDLFVYQGHTSWVHSVAWSPNGTRIASGSSDNTVQIWDAANGRFPLITCRGHTNEIYTVAWSPDGNRVASASLDGTVRIWDATHEGNALVVYRGHVGAQVNTVAWSPDGSHCVSGSWDFTAQVWDAATGGEPFIVYRGHKDNVNAVTWSPDGKYIASGSSDNTLQIWDAADGNPIVTYHSSYPISVAWSPDGKHIASGDQNSTVQEWQAI